MKVLQVIDQGFRTTVEEQDDTILWLTQSMRGAGGDLIVLLTGHGSYYAVQSRRQPAITLGDWQQTEPADITQDIARLTNQQVPVYVLKEDLEERGLTACLCNRVLKLLLAMRYRTYMKALIKYGIGKQGWLKGHE